MTNRASRADEWIDLAAGKYLNTVYRLAHARTQSRQDAEDVTQEVLLKLVAHADRIESEAHLKHWLIRVTVNQSASLFRSAWRRLTMPLNEAVLESAGPPAADPDLDAVLQGLNRNLRTVVHLFYYEDMSVAEIADALHIRPEAVKTRLSRARKLLRTQLTEEGRTNDVSERLPDEI